MLNDADFTYWQTFGARAWPTLYFIDPRGNVIGIHEGELTEDMAAPLIDGWLAEYEAESVLTAATWAWSARPGATARSLSRARSPGTTPQDGWSSRTATTIGSSSPTSTATCRL